MRYIPITEDERREMLTSLGLEKIDDLFQDIPQEAIFQGELDVPGPLSEAELIRHFRELAAKNQDATKLVSFLGAGVYDHLTPSIIKHIIGRGEFLTAYTPYQPEITQGVLQSIFEYQTMICELTAMDAANASMYDGASALAEACLMACAATRRELVILPATLHPEWQEVVRLYLENQDVAMVYLPQDPQTGTVDLSRLDEVPWAEAACVVVQQPNFFGLLEPVAELEKRVHENGGLLVMAVDPISLSLLKPPGS